ncbi:SDR family oxidoreductase [Fulvivirga sp. M361]|nr:SDR family oxidoreductase [Fulvivirga sp. M361]
MQTLFNLNGKVAAISGGSGILGTAMARALAREGVAIALLDRDPEKSDELLVEAEQNGWKIKAYRSDVLDEEVMRSVRAELLNDYGKIDVLINAAGGNMPGSTVGPDQSILDLSVADTKKVLELNYLGSVIPTQVFLEPMISAKAGCIINISSMSAQQPLTRVMGYSSAKASIDNYTKWLAVELAGKFGEGFRVNALAPGFFLTDQNRSLLTNEDGSLTARGKTIVEHTPFGRFGAPEELAGTLIWLCSDASKFVTGTIIPIDGGFSAFSGV